MHTLSEEHYVRARPLFAGQRDHPVIQAIIEGNNPGRIYVDNLVRPTAALVWAKSEQAYFLAGDPGNAAFAEELGAWIDAVIVPEAVAGGEREFAMQLCAAGWEAQVGTILRNRAVWTAQQSAYRLDVGRFQQRGDWRERVPPGLQMQRMDARLLLKVVDDGAGTLFKRWWRSYDEFARLGLGYCLLQGEAVLSTCFACFVGAGAVEIGIVTEGAHQRRGYATLVAEAFIVECLTRGLAPHWSCSTRNVPSAALAGKLGFVKQGEVTVYGFSY